MIPLTEIITKMSLEEQKKFELFLKKGNQKADNQKLKLYKALKSQKLSLKEIPSHIYGKENKTAYHQLRKRLFNELVDFISYERFENEEEKLVEITKLMLAGKHLIESKNYKAGFKLLQAAENKAKQQMDVISLNEIYNLQVHFAHYNPNNNLEEYIQKLEKNRKAYIQESNLNMAYALVKAKLEEHRLKGTMMDIEKLFDSILKRFDIKEETGYNFKTLYQLVQIVTASAKVTNNYHKISRFVLEKYTQIIEKNEEDYRHLFYHLKLLYFIANIFFRAKSFEKSNEYLNKMQELIQKHKNYSKLFSTKIKVLNSLNFNYLGNHKTASELIESAIHSQKDSKNKDYLDALIVSSLIHFQQKEFKKIQTIFSKLHLSDSWYTKTMGAKWVMNKNLIEILTHIELENIDYVDARMDSFLFKNKEYLSQDHRAAIFLKFLQKSYKHPESVTTENFKKEFYDSVFIGKTKREDIYTISFYAYLKAKMSKKDVYQTTLSILEEERKKYKDEMN